MKILLFYCFFIKTHISSNLVDCEWSEWSSWSDCSETCGGGMQTAKRRIITKALFGGKECPEESEKTNKCNIDPCPGIYMN